MSEIERNVADGLIELTASQHTPGPWSYRGTLGPRHVESMGGPCVIEVASTGRQLAIMSGCRTDTQRADARLMAAAPDLLEVLRAITNDRGTWNCMPMHLRDMAGAALARAVGRSA